MGKRFTSSFQLLVSASRILGILMGFLRLVAGGTGAMDEREECCSHSSPLTLSGNASVE